MGGPGASVLIHNARTKQQEDELEIWLRSMTHDLEKDKWGYQFWWNKTDVPLQSGVVQCIRFQEDIVRQVNK